jgi:hypothetical protein
MEQSASHFAGTNCFMVKAAIVNEIVDKVRNQRPAGRFLKKVEATGEWSDVTTTGAFMEVAALLHHRAGRSDAEPRATLDAAAATDQNSDGGDRQNPAPAREPRRSMVTPTFPVLRSPANPAGAGGALILVASTNKGRTRWSDDEMRIVRELALQCENLRSFTAIAMDKLKGRNEKAFEYMWYKLKQGKRREWWKPEDDLILRKYLEDGQGDPHSRKELKKKLPGRTDGSIRMRLNHIKKVSQKQAAPSGSPAAAAGSAPGPSESHAAEPSRGPAVQPAAAASPPGERPGATGEPE